MMRSQTVFQLAGLNLKRVNKPERAAPAADKLKVHTLTSLNGHTSKLAVEMNRIIWVNEPDGAITRYRYDESNRVIARTDAYGRATNYTYDDRGRVIRVSHAGGPALSVQYDDQNHPISRVMPAGDTARFEYKTGRLSVARFGTYDTIIFDYDESERLRTVTETGCITRYIYGSDGQLAEITRSIDELSFSFRFDAEANLIEIHLPKAEVLSFEQKETECAWKFEADTMEFDRAGNVISNKAGQFAYDVSDRLIEATQPGAGVIRYEYDLAGNRIARHGPEGYTAYAYDERDQLTRISKPGGVTVDFKHDANGNLTHKSTGQTTYRYQYNGRQQLECIYKNEEIVARYRYDFNGRRIWRQVGQQISLYHYDLRGRLAAITREDGSLAAAFAYHRDRIAVRALVSSGEIRTFFLYADHLGSTHQITNTGGQVIWQGSYSPFGRLKVDPPEFDCPLYAGQLWDAESGFYYFGARYYDPNTGRFISPDPCAGGPDDFRLFFDSMIRNDTGNAHSTFAQASEQISALSRISNSPAPESVCPPLIWLAYPKMFHRYAYCLNNPMTFADPQGMSVMGTIGKTVLAFIWSSVWTLLGGAITILDWIFQFPLLGFLYLPSYGLAGVSSSRLGSAAMINVGGLGPAPLVLANILFAKRGFVDELNDTVQEYLIPAEANSNPRQLRTARTAYFEHLLSHTVQANFSGPFWPFVYLFGSDAMERDATRDSGITRIAEPTLTVVPDEVHRLPAGNFKYKLIVIGGQKPYRIELSDRNIGSVSAFIDSPRFSECDFLPKYKPGKYTITVKDNAGFSDKRDVKIARLSIDGIEVKRPNTLFIDNISDPNFPTLRLVDQANASVRFDIEPDEGEMRYEADPANSLDLLGASGAAITSAIGDTDVNIKPHAAPTAVTAAAGATPATGDAPQDSIIHVKSWDSTAADILKNLRVRSMATITVVLQIYIVQDDDGSHPSFTGDQVTALITKANQIWAQAGIQFVTRAATLFINESDFKIISITCQPPGGLTSTEDDLMFRWRPTPPGPRAAPLDNNNQDSNAIHVYFIEDFDPSDCAVAYAGLSSNYVVVARTRGPTTLAHELGHCLGLGHPEEETPAPRELAKRLMKSGETTRGEPYLIANQASPARTGNGADETANARREAINRMGP